MSIFIDPTACVDSGASIGDGTSIWHYAHIRGSAMIGPDCNIGQNVYIDANVVIGKGCKIQNNVSVYQHVRLEDNVFCGPGVVFTNVRNPRAAIKKMDRALATIVGQGATIGGNATIICGVTIGAYAFVGAGAVVTHNVPAHGLVIGNPARISGWVCECGEKLGADGACPACGQQWTFGGQA